MIKSFCGAELADSLNVDRSLTCHEQNTGRGLYRSTQRAWNFYMCSYRPTIETFQNAIISRRDCCARASQEKEKIGIRFHLFSRSSDSVSQQCLEFLPCPSINNQRNNQRFVVLPETVNILSHSGT